MYSFADTRYNRQEVMPEWGQEGQRRLAKASVGVVGAGGVKSTLLMCLAAAGVGNILIAENDVVELSNLNRQLLFSTADIGRRKADAALETLSELNPTINIQAVHDKVTEDTIAYAFEDCEFIVEGGDSPAGRNLVNRYCLETGKPMVHASAQFSYGYVFSVVPAWNTACFACFFPEDHTRTEHTGAVPVNTLSTSVAGSLGAAEVIKWFIGHREAMVVNRRLCFSSLLLSEEFTYEEQPRRPNCPVCSHRSRGGVT
jgi:adenylyltransferase/sulfurtransferase